MIEDGSLVAQLRHNSFMTIKFINLSESMPVLNLSKFCLFAGINQTSFLGLAHQINKLQGARRNVCLPVGFVIWIDYYFHFVFIARSRLLGQSGVVFTKDWLTRYCDRTLN